jgi:hypothetical protein
MVDFGGSDDGMCEHFFFTRCYSKSVATVTFGQQEAWTYNYCEQHRQWALEAYPDAKEIKWLNS